jgi:hypothetical protein
MRFAIVVIVVVAACSAPRAAPQPAVTWSAPIEIARGGGMKGPWQQNQSQFDYVDDGSVALAGDGAAAVAWVDQRTKDVHFQIYEPDGRARFAQPANVSRTPVVFSWLPRVELAGDAVYVLWQEIVFSGGTHGGEAFFARSLDGGNTFEAPQNLSRSKNGDGKGRLDATRWDNGSLDLAVAADGTLHAAWTEYDGPLWASRSEDRGATWSAPQQIGGTRERPARAPALATSGRTVYLAWTVGEDRRGDLHLARSTDAGVTFGEPAQIARTTGYSDAPKLAVDGAGTLHVAWAEHDGGWDTRAAIHYTRARDGAAFERPRAISAPGAGFPALALDGEHVWISWELYRRAGEPPRGLAITHSLDGGDTFASPIVVDGSTDPDGGWNGSQQGKLTRKLAVRDDRIALVNSALEHGDHSRVWLLRGRRTR